MKFQDYPTDIVIFYTVGLYTSAYALLAALFASVYALGAWQRRRKARPGIEAAEARLSAAQAEHERTTERLKARTAHLEETNRRLHDRLDEANQRYRDRLDALTKGHAS